MIKKGRYCFLMDEYHYINEPGKKLKLVYDTFTDTKFIVTGSSSLEISGAMGRFLVGRVFFFELFPFSFHEFLVAKDLRLAKIYEKTNRELKHFLIENKLPKIKEDIFLKELLPYFNEYLIFGGYPAVIKEKDFETKKAILKGIYDTYISKDVIEFLRVSDSFKYRHAVRFLSSMIGKIINYNEFCSATQSYYKEIKKTLSILSETYIIQLVQPFYRNPLTELRKAPKVYFYDLGLRNHIIDNFNSIEKRTDTGELAENFVFIALRNSFPDYEIKYWRTIAKAEVDFIVRLGEEVIPIEVKYKNIITPKISRGLRSFIKTYKPKKALVVTKNLWSRMKINRTHVLFIPICYL